MIWVEWIAGVFGVATVAAVLAGAYLRRLTAAEQDDLDPLREFNQDAIWPGSPPRPSSPWENDSPGRGGRGP